MLLEQNLRATQRFRATSFFVQADVLGALVKGTFRSVEAREEFETGDTREGRKGPLPLPLIVGSKRWNERSRSLKQRVFF